MAAPTPATRLQQTNRVLDAAYSPSANFYHSDLPLREYIQRHWTDDALLYQTPILERVGRQAAQEMDELSMLADKQGPVLVPRNRFGETVNDIRFHPAYQRLLEIAVESEMFRIKWEPGLRQRFAAQRNSMGFASGYLFAMAESGQYCPLCMTDGAALLLHKYARQQDIDRILPHVYTTDAADLFTGAMFLTEKAGGSDVGANLVQATKATDDPADPTYHLNGEKWFCSNANAEFIFALARTNPNVPGTRGLGIFLVEKHLPDGSRNPMNFLRLKDKLGVRSMASAEIILTDTVGTLVGGETEGFKIMTDMINLSRLYNSVAAITVGRRALVEAYQFLCYRTSFGKNALQHALVREKLHELGALHIGQFYLTWRAIAALDAAEQGDERSAQLLRLLTPMTKRHTAETCVYLCRESMELWGGLGYIEDTIMPKLFRDANVLPIWEGAGNIMILDMLRAAAKSDGLPTLLAEIQAAVPLAQSLDTRYADLLTDEVRSLGKAFAGLMALPQDQLEASAKPLFLRLTSVYQLALLVQNRSAATAPWIDPALVWFANHLQPDPYRTTTPLTVSEVQGLMGWEF